MPGQGLLRGTIVSATIHAALALGILLALGYPFLAEILPEPPQIEMLLEPLPDDGPPAEPKPQDRATPEPSAKEDPALESLARNLSGIRDRPARTAQPPAPARSTTPPHENPAPPPRERPLPAQAAPAPQPEPRLPTAMPQPAQTTVPPEQPQALKPPQRAPEPGDTPATTPPDLPRLEATAPAAGGPGLPAENSERRPDPAAAPPRRTAGTATYSDAAAPPHSEAAAPPQPPPPAPLPATIPAPSRSAGSSAGAADTGPARRDKAPPEKASLEEAPLEKPLPPVPALPASQPPLAPARPLTRQPVTEPPVPERPAAETPSPGITRPSRMESLAEVRRETATQDLTAAREAAVRARSAASQTRDLLQALASRLRDLLAAAEPGWAKEQLAGAEARARAEADSAEQAAELAEASAGAAADLAAGLDQGASPAALLRRADAIAMARGRAEQAARSAEDRQARLQQVADLHLPPQTLPDMPFPPATAEPGPVGRAPQVGRAQQEVPPAISVPAGRPELRNAGITAIASPGAGETALQRGSAQVAAIAWLSDRLQRQIERIQGNPAGLASPDARVAMRALEMRGRNLDSAAAKVAAAMQEAEERLRAARQQGLPSPPPDPALQHRVEAANAAFVASARSVAEAIDPVIARLPQEEAQWAKVMRASYDWLVERRRLDGAPEQTPDSVAPPVPTPHQRQVLRAAREADPMLPEIERGAEQPDRRQGLQAALNAARMHHIARSGTPSALYNLANALLDADGMARDPRRAGAILKTLAEQGYRPAQVRYAEIAMLGEGRPADPAEALAWYRIAAINGSTAGQKAGAAMALELTPEVRAEAERIVAQWLAMQGPETKPGQDELDRDLAAAIQNQNYAEAETLLQTGANPQALDDGGRTALVGAAWRGRNNIVRLLMEHGVLTDVRDAENRSALLWSAINGYPQIADDLLDFGAAVDIADAQGATPLIRAAWNGKYGVAERLMAAGADPRLRDDEGRTAIDRAAGEGDSRMLRILGGKPGPP